MNTQKLNNDELQNTYGGSEFSEAVFRLAGMFAKLGTYTSHPNHAGKI